MQLTVDRTALVRRGLLLNWLTIGYNTVEAMISLTAGIATGSVALVGFGMDSVIEVTASGAAQWRLRSDRVEGRRATAERLARRIIGWSFIALGAYVGADAVAALVLREEPKRSVVGVLLLAVSVVVMPVLASRKRQVARALTSGALEAEAAQTALCAYLSVIALAGVGLNSALGWWWADPVSALAMTPIIMKEGWDGIRGGRACPDGC